MNDPKINPRRTGLLQVTVGGVISPTWHAGVDLQRCAEPSSSDSPLSFLVESLFIFLTTVFFFQGCFFEMQFTTIISECARAAPGVIKTRNLNNKRQGELKVHLY